MNTDKKSFLEDENSTGFCVMISGLVKGKTQISFKSRTNPGAPLTEVSIDDASDSQLSAVCDVLDNL